MNIVVYFGIGLLTVFLIFLIIKFLPEKITFYLIITFVIAAITFMVFVGLAVIGKLVVEIIKLFFP